MTNHSEYDVVILGSGIAGSMLGAILARHGLKPLLLDAGTHPRFAVGEATTPDTSFRLKLLSVKYDLPEIFNLSSFHRLRDFVSPACGVKRAFSFLYQRDGLEQDPAESHQYPTLAPPTGPDCHFFRQDTDAYMLSVALNYGCQIRQSTQAKEIEFEEDRVHITTQRGERITTQYLVDAAGFRSPLADRFDLRDDPDTLRTNSRTIFTHMVGIKLMDQVGQPFQRYGLKYPLSQGTLHHVFEGGWFWVIPFNNHKDAVNPLCSIGVVLNRELYPETGKDAEEEFWEVVNRFPEIARQLEGATVARPWVSTGRLQYCSKRVTGHRFCLLAHAAGFIDPLFYSGLALTAYTVDMLSNRLLQAFANNDFSVESFRDVDSCFREGLKHYDEVVGCSFVAFRDFDLWDAWFRVWVVAVLISTGQNANLYFRYLESQDRKVLEESQRPPYNGVLGMNFGDFRQLYDTALAEMDAVRDGRAAPKEAADRIRALFIGIKYCPTYWRWPDKSVRTTPAFTVWGMTKMYFWYFFNAPRHVRKAMWDWSPLTAYRYILGSILDSRRSAARRRRHFLRDVFRAWNTDWSPEPVARKGAPAR
ncbi:MAG TPA: FAD-dependent oxidoreductase [Thermoanaerobaculia bacterium]|nr:FAD-dependent oxidoreductase [Thermoanaerobaculia bacterium]